MYNGDCLINYFSDTMALEVVRFSAGLMFCKNFVIHVNAVKQFKVQWSVHAQKRDWVSYHIISGVAMWIIYLIYDFYSMYNSPRKQSSHVTNACIYQRVNHIRFFNDF